MHRHAHARVVLALLLAIASRASAGEVGVRELTEFPILTPNSNPVGITTGPFGHIGFTEYDADQIGRITSSDGTIKEFVIPTHPSRPGFNIALGTTAADACPSFDTSGDGAVTVDELLAAVNRVFNGCGNAAAAVED